MEPEIVLSDDLEIHFLELPKLAAGPYSLEDSLVKWLLFIRWVEKERWEELAQGEPPLKKAMTTLEFLSQDKEARRLYEMRQKALHDLRSMTEGAKEEGRKEGKKEGREETARNLLLMGLDASLIAEATGLSPQEIEELRK